MLFFSLSPFVVFVLFFFKVLSSHAITTDYYLSLWSSSRRTGTATLKIQQWAPGGSFSLLGPQCHLLSRPSYHVQRSFAPISLSLIFFSFSFLFVDLLFFICLCFGVSCRVVSLFSSSVIHRKHRARLLLWAVCCLVHDTRWRNGWSARPLCSALGHPAITAPLRDHSSSRSHTIASINIDRGTFVCQLSAAALIRVIVTIIIRQIQPQQWEWE